MVMFRHRQPKEKTQPYYELLASPLVPFEELRAKFPNFYGLPDPEPQDLNKDTTTTNKPSDQNDKQEGQNAENVPQGTDSQTNNPTEQQKTVQTAQQQQPAFKKFEIYGGRSLKHGAAFLAALLCQNLTISQDPSAQNLAQNGPQRLTSQNNGSRQEPRFSKLLMKEYIKFMWAIGRCQVLLVSVLQEERECDPSEEYKHFLRAVVNLAYVTKDIVFQFKGLMQPSTPEEVMYTGGELISSFFEYSVSILRQIPLYANEMRYLALLQFNDVIFQTIFGREDFRAVQESTKALLHSKVDSLLREDVIHTSKQVNNPAIQIQFMTLYQTYDLFQKELSPDQLCCIAEFLMQFILHPLMSTYQRNRVIKYLNCILERSLINKTQDIDVQVRSIKIQQRQEQPEQFQKLQKLALRVRELQNESLKNMCKVSKMLLEQTEKAIEYFKKNSGGEMRLQGSIGGRKAFERSQAYKESQKKKTEAQNEDLKSEEKDHYVNQPVNDKENLPFDSIFVLREQDLVDSYNDSFEVSWQKISQQAEEQLEVMNQHTQINKELRFRTKKENLYKTAREAMITFNYTLQWMRRNQRVFGNREMKQFRKFLKRNCRLIQNFTQILPEDVSLKNLSKLLQSIIISRLKVNYFNDLILSCREELFGLAIESKVKESKFGMDYMVLNMILFYKVPENLKENPGKLLEQSRIKLIQDQYIATFQEHFFDYLKEKVEIFEAQNETDGEVASCGLSEQEKRLAKLPNNDVLEAITNLILTLGEQALKNLNEMRVKQLFFNILIFCIKKIRSGKIVPKYFHIIKQLVKSIALYENFHELKELHYEFKPLLHGLLETFLQAKQETSYAKEINEICIALPDTTKFKSTLDLLPAIWNPLIDSMGQYQITALKTFQFIFVCLVNFPTLLNPILETYQSDLNKALHGTILQYSIHHANIIQKHLGKFGGKARIYSNDNKLKQRNFPEDGLKITLRDKNSGKTITFGIDAVINELFTHLTSHWNTYSNKLLKQSQDLVKSAFLSYIDPDLDLDFIIATIVATKEGVESPSESIFAKHGIKIPGFSLNGRERQVYVSQMGRGCESHAFVKLLRCVIMSYKPYSVTPEVYKKQQRKQNDFMKWITQYFTLIFICKNGNLTHTMVDEINPLVFIDLIVEVLYVYIENPQLPNKQKDLPFYMGSAVALKTMIRFIVKLYGDSQDIFSRLEIIEIIIQKICNQVNDLNKNLAINVAIKILIKELPTYVLRTHAELLLTTLLQILGQSSESVAGSIEIKVIVTIDLLLTKLGIYEISKSFGLGLNLYSFNLGNFSNDPQWLQLLGESYSNMPQNKSTTSTNMPDQISNNEQLKFIGKIIEIILEHTLSHNTEMTQSLAISLIEKIAKQNEVSVNQLLRTIKRSPKIENQSSSANKLTTPPVDFMNHIFESEIKGKMNSIFEMYKGGYTSIQSLLSLLNTVTFFLQHDRQIILSDQTFLVFADYILLLLQDECNKFQLARQAVQEPIQGPNPSIMRLARRYSKLERIYQAYNHAFDPYSHLLQPHTLYTTYFFEQTQLAKDELFKEEEDLMKQNIRKDQESTLLKNTQLPVPPSEQLANGSNSQDPKADVKMSGESEDIQIKNEEKTGEQNKKQDNQPSEAERQKALQKLTSERINSFLEKVFPNAKQRDSVPQKRQSGVFLDLTEELIGSLYEIFPNVRQHVTLIGKCMKLLTELCIHLSKSGKLTKYWEHFLPYQSSKSSSERQQAIQVELQKLNQSKDFYMIEIQWKSVSSLIKMFLEDEFGLQKAAKKQIKRLFTLNRFDIPQIVVCQCVDHVKYSRNVNFLYQIGRLFRIMPKSFQENIPKKEIEQKITEILKEYNYLLFTLDGTTRQLVPRRRSQTNLNGQNAKNGQQQPGNDPQMLQQNQGVPQMPTQREDFELELNNLVSQYNWKVQDINSVIYIINSLHLLRIQENNKDQILSYITLVEQILFFHRELIEKFKENFELQFEDVLSKVQNIGVQVELRQKFYQDMVPIHNKLGYLKCEILEGIEKFFNSNVHLVRWILYKQDKNLINSKKIVLELIKNQQNFCIRNQISLDKVFINLQYDKAFLINLVYAYSKFFPQCLINKKNTQLLDILRENWLNKDSYLDRSQQNNEHLDAGIMEMKKSEKRDFFMKIQKILVVYCRDDNAESQILFDLLKGFQSKFELDLKPLVHLCTVDIPSKAQKKRKVTIMEHTLNKIQNSRARFDMKYCMFEFAFMPLILSCAFDKAKFDDLFTYSDKTKHSDLIINFLHTFFDKGRQFPIWKQIQSEMNLNQSMSPNAFFSEILKVLLIILRHTEMADTLISEKLSLTFFLYEIIFQPKIEKMTQSLAICVLSTLIYQLQQMKEKKPKIMEKLNFSQKNIDLMHSQLLEMATEDLRDPLYKQVTSHLKDLCKSEEFHYRAKLSDRLNCSFFEVNSKVLIQGAFENMQKLYTNTDDAWITFQKKLSMQSNLKGKLILCSLINSSPPGVTRQLSNKVVRHLSDVVIKFLHLPRYFSLQNFVQYNEILKLIYEILRNLAQDYENKVNQINLTSNDVTHLLNQHHQQLQQLINVCRQLFLIILNQLVSEQFILIKAQARANNPILQGFEQEIQASQENQFITLVNNCFGLIRELFGRAKQQYPVNREPIFESFQKQEKYAIKLTFQLNEVALNLRNMESGTTDFKSLSILTDLLQSTYIPIYEIKNFPNYDKAENVRTTPLITKKFKPKGIFEGNASSTQDDYPLNKIASNSFGINMQGQTFLSQGFSEVQYQINTILHPIHLIEMAITKGSKEVRDTLKPFLVQAMWYEIREAQAKDLKQIQSQLVLDFNQNSINSIKNLQRQSQQQGQMPAQQALNLKVQKEQAQSAIIRSILASVNDEQQKVSKCLPHFTIRMIHKMEQIRDKGIISKEEFKEWVDTDFYVHLAGIINKVVISFRQIICIDKASLIPEGEGTEKTESTAKKGYKNWQFKNDLAPFELTEVDFDIWTKETVMIGIQSVVSLLKTEISPEESLVVYDQIKLTFKGFWFLRMKTCDYLLEQFYEVIKIIYDKEGQRIKLTVIEKLNLVYRLLILTRPQDIQNGTSDPNSIINKICNLCLDFLESQDSLLTLEQHMRTFDKLMQFSQFCDYSVGQRLFKIFEKFNGSSLKAKIFYFFNKLTLESRFDAFRDNAQLKILLELTLYNFKENTSLQKIRNATTLCPLSCQQTQIEGVETLKESTQGKQILDTLSPFVAKYQKYRDYNLERLLKPLSEVIKINTEIPFRDKNIAEKLFSKIFHQYWQILDRNDQLQLSEIFNKVFQNSIKLFGTYFSMNSPLKQQFVGTLLEQVVSLKEPQVRLDPEILQYLGKHFNLWHIVIPQLEDHVQIFKNNERYVHSLQELYNGLLEEDYQIGLSRLVTKSPEMRSMYTFAQHQRWQEINSIFGQYMNFYAEQEGLFHFLEQDQDMPGKYSRQLGKNQLIDIINNDESRVKQQQIQQPNSGAQTYEEVFVNEPGQAQRLKSRQFPRAGSNRRITDIDLRQWESLYMTSVKILKQHDLYRDVSNSAQRSDLMLENHWAIKNNSLTQDIKKVIMQQNQSQVPHGGLQKVRNHIYYAYILGCQIDLDNRTGNDDRKEFCENSKLVTDLCVKHITEFLPQYIDTIQYEYYIMFQQILESYEGIQNFIIEQGKNDIYKKERQENLNYMMQMWRERLPNQCESIQTWQDLLENRNYIFRKLQNKIQRATVTRMNQQYAQAQMLHAQNQIIIDANGNQVPNPNQTQLPALEMTQLDKLKLIDSVDEVWNNLKLAEISRKHGLPNLSQDYLATVQKFLESNNCRGDILKQERFKFLYENFKLQMNFRQNETIRNHSLEHLGKQTENGEYYPWMQAEFSRIMGEQYLAQGNIKQASERLKQSLDKNKRETRTWLAFAKLNEIVFTSQHDETSACNVLKGYFCAIALAHHKARLIMPNLLRLFKQKSIYDAKQSQTNNQTATQKVDTSTSLQANGSGGQTAGEKSKQQHQMSPATLCALRNAYSIPIWLWIFWLPQILLMLSPQQQNSPNQFQLQRILKMIVDNVSRLYPQVVYYPLRALKQFQPYLDKKFKNQNQPGTSFERLLYQNGPIYSNQLSRKVIEKRNEKLFSDINVLIQKLGQVTKQSDEEYMVKALKNCWKNLNFRNLLSKLKPDEGWEDFLTQFYQKCCSVDKDNVLVKEVRREWTRLLQNSETKETSFLEQIKIVKNIKDFLFIQCNMREQDLPVQEFSQFLATFAPKGVELPGQYVVSEQEPRPETIIYINKVGSKVQRLGLKDKKISFVCNNGRQYHFTVSQLHSVRDLQVFLSNERVTQFKSVANIMLRKHKESARRGLKFYCSPQVIHQSVRLVQDDKCFSDFQETHDYLLQERGLDPDMALLLQIQNVQDIMKTVDPQNPQKLARFNDGQIREVSRSCYDLMRSEVAPSLLTSYFHRIFSNVDNMFIFKKQFTKYLAVNSLFCYAFNQGSISDLNSLQFCKQTGAINFGNAAFQHAINLLPVSMNNYEEIEAKLFKIHPVVQETPGVPLTETQQKMRQIAQKQTYYVPFRMTPNIEEFVGKIGINGLFAGVMTSASLAFASQTQKVHSLVELLFAEEIKSYKKDSELAIEEEAQRQTDFVLFKIASLSEHAKIFPQPPKSEESKCPPLPQTGQKYKNLAYDEATGSYILGQYRIPKEFLDLESDRPNIPEEFNKKVFALIEIATDDNRRSQKPATWCPWF